MTVWKFPALLGLILVSEWASRGASAQPPDEDVVDTIRAQALFFETFDSDEWQSRWRHSSDAKYNGRFTTGAAKGWTNNGLKIPEQNKYYGLAALLDSPVDPVVAASPASLPLVVQYEVKYDAGVTCGGSYIKLLTADPALTPESLVDSTPYSIMFGPDRCGGTSKVHFILRHRNPLNGTITEKHLASPPAAESNDHTHIYTLLLFPDHEFEVLVDGVIRSSGNLLDGAMVQPPLLPPREVPDPTDTKPADWVDASEIPDPDAVKPDDWDEREMIEDEKAVKPRGWLEDEPALINDPAAKRPEDWDDEEDGEWEPNQIPNPRCKVGCGPWNRPLKRNPAWKGAWKPPLINNPDYKGPWVQKRIPNPDFFEEAEPIRTGVAPIGGVALELWTIDSGYLFDNILITRDRDVARRALQELWKPRYDAEVKEKEAQLKEKEAKDKEREKEEARKAKAARKAARKAKGSRFSNDQLEQLTEGVLELFEDGAPLAPLAPFLAPLLTYLRGNPQGIVLLLGLAPLLLLTTIMLLRSSAGGHKKRPAAAAATEEGEAVGAEEDQPAAVEEEPAEGKASGNAKTPAAEAAPGAKHSEEAAAAGEIEEEDEDDA